MRRLNVMLLVAMVLSAQGAAAQTADGQRALAAEIERRFQVLPVQAGLVLTPRDNRGGARSIELTGGAIALDGQPVTGAELRSRLGADADLVLRLSYLDQPAQHALFAVAGPAAPPAPAPAPPGPAVPPSVAPAPSVDPPGPSGPPGPAGRDGNRGNDRVRFGGNVSVGAGEVIDGDVVAIGGNVEVNGEVSGDVVAIGGGLTLGPQAAVDGDAVVIGGGLQRDPAARVRGEIVEIGFGGFAWPGPGRMGPMGGFFPGPNSGRFFALVGTFARLAVWAILAAIVLLFSRDYVQRVGVRAASEPLKAGAVGLLIQLLFFPVLIATIVLMVITLIGIPLLVLVPFALLAFAVLWFVGFTAAAYEVGRLAAARFGVATANPYLVAALGIGLILLPVLIARLVGFGGPVLAPIAWTLLFVGILFEYLAWTVGLGALALLRFDRPRPPAVTVAP